MVERDLNELLLALGVDDASKVMVYAAPPEWSDDSDWTAYRCAADSGDVEVAITERECEVLLAAGAASGESRPLAGF